MSDQLSLFPVKIVVRDKEEEVMAYEARETHKPVPIEAEVLRLAHKYGFHKLEVTKILSFQDDPHRGDGIQGDVVIMRYVAVVRVTSDDGTEWYEDAASAGADSIDNQNIKPYAVETAVRRARVRALSLALRIKGINVDVEFPSYNGEITLPQGESPLKSGEKPGTREVKSEVVAETQGQDAGAPPETPETDDGKEDQGPKPRKIYKKNKDAILQSLAKYGVSKDKAVALFCELQLDGIKSLDDLTNNEAKLLLEGSVIEEMVTAFKIRVAEIRKQKENGNSE